MENTRDNKLKFYAQYYGQRVQKRDYDNHLYSVDGVLFNDCRLELKPLSSISDEDAIQVLRILGEYQPKPITISHHEENGRNWTRISRPYVDDFGLPVSNVLFNVGNSGTINHHKNSRGEDHLCAYDYLRSRGYALPWNGLSVEKQIEYNWVKIVENGK